MDVLAPEGLQQLWLKSFPSSAGAGSSTYNVGFNCVEPSPDLGHAHGHPAGSEAEDSDRGCWRPIQAAQQGEEAEDLVECLHAAVGCERSRCLTDLPEQDNLALLSFLNDTMGMLLKIHTFYTVLIHKHMYFKPHRLLSLTHCFFTLRVQEKIPKEAKKPHKQNIKNQTKE